MAKKTKAANANAALICRDAHTPKQLQAAVAALDASIPLFAPKTLDFQHSISPAAESRSDQSEERAKEAQAVGGRVQRLVELMFETLNYSILSRKTIICLCWPAMSCAAFVL